MKSDGGRRGVQKLTLSFGVSYQPTEESSFYVEEALGSASNFTTGFRRIAYSPYASKSLKIGLELVF
ncbi:hypothetical protein [Undibacterium sp.]|uniref:hypothetical protein n=1 Tax=Undibacterium sp. TaxID=1914977 RepID=UPI00374FDC6B